MHEALSTFFRLNGFLSTCRAQYSMFGAGSQGRQDDVRRVDWCAILKMNELR